MNKIESVNSIHTRNLAELQKSKIAFCQTKSTNAPDSFEAEKVKKEKTKLEIAILTITGAGVAALAVVRGKLGKALKLIGEDAPLTLFGRMKKLSDIASKDVLTKNIYNSRTIKETIKKEFARASKNDQNLSVAMFDMDNFKLINELFGHKEGDNVLVRIGELIETVAKKHGADGGRYGGEEFIFVLRGKTPAESEIMAQEFSDAIKTDKVLQGYFPKFKSKTEDAFAFLEPKIKQIDSIFNKCRKSDKTTAEQKELVDNIISLIEQHIERYKPKNGNLKNLEEIIKKLRTEPPEKINIFDTIIGKDSTIAEELSNIQSNYKGLIKDIYSRAKTQIDDHGALTVSGGVSHLKEYKNSIKSEETLINAADEAMGHAKKNGRNQIFIADKDTIEDAINNASKKK